MHDGRGRGGGVIEMVHREKTTFKNPSSYAESMINIPAQEKTTFTSLIKF